jgi:hypothetical protein
MSPSGRTDVTGSSATEWFRCWGVVIVATRNACARRRSRSRSRRTSKVAARLLTPRFERCAKAQQLVYIRSHTPRLHILGQQGSKRGVTTPSRRVHAKPCCNSVRTRCHNPLVCTIGVCVTNDDGRGAISLSAAWFGVRLTNLVSRRCGGDRGHATRMVKKQNLKRLVCREI